MAETLADQFEKIVKKYPTKDFKNQWTKGMADYKTETGKKRPGESDFLGLGRKSTGISDSLEAINDLQVAFVKNIKKKSQFINPDDGAIIVADKYLSQFDAAIKSCSTKIDAYLAVSRADFDKREKKLAIETHAASNLTKEKAAAKDQQKKLAAIEKEFVQKQKAHKLLEKTHLDLLERPLKATEKRLADFYEELAEVVIEQKNRSYKRNQKRRGSVSSSDSD